jgi:hypothetical protein
MAFPVGFAAKPDDPIGCVDWGCKIAANQVAAGLISTQHVAGNLELENAFLRSSREPPANRKQEVLSAVVQLHPPAQPPR